MKPRIAVIGAGAVGGYVGGMLARAGHDVVLVDAWPEHVERMKRDGLKLSDPLGSVTVPVEAAHVHEVQAFIRKPVDIAMVCTKSYDTIWTTTLVRQYLAPRGYVVSIQNSLNEEMIASIVGWERTVGCIASTISVGMPGPGEISRMRTPGGAAYTVFRVGEPHGRVTPRAEALVALLSCVDSAKVTTNLWGERWAKLTTNSMHHGIQGAAGLTDHQIMQDTPIRRLAIRCAGEAIAVANALGHEPEPILRMAPSLWRRAAAGDAEALAQVESGWVTWMERSKEPHPGSVGQDLEKARRTEIDYTCGYVASKGAQIGVPAPTQGALAALVKRIERGEIARGPGNLAPLLATK
jgi:2-dehydropantoate 2-reductase